MTREERLAFCKKCMKRKMDFQHGLLCSLTGEKATFEGECPDFELDPAVKETPVVTQEENAHPVSIINKLSAEKLAVFKEEQNLNLAIGVGLIVGLLGAILWGTITVITNYQIGYMAIAIGAGVGVSMRHFGKGVDQVFGIMGALIAVAACFLGNFLSIIGYLANAEELSYFYTLMEFNYAYFFPIMGETFSGMDILFYGFAAYEGYKFSFRTITAEDL